MTPFFLFLESGEGDLDLDGDLLLDRPDGLPVSFFRAPGEMSTSFASAGLGLGERDLSFDDSFVSTILGGDLSLSGLSDLFDRFLSFFFPLLRL